jgi:4-aminobutyrate aminotransferase-like enzyme
MSSTKEKSPAKIIFPERWSHPVLSRGAGSKVWDVTGREYIDCHSGPGVLAIGHGHPEYIGALKSQLDKLMIAPANKWHEPLIELQNVLGDVLPPNLLNFFLFNSGSEANEGAIKVAKKYAHSVGRTGGCVVSLEYSFHGLTSLTLSLTGMYKTKRGLGSFANSPGSLVIPAPYVYRYPGGAEACAAHCISALESLIESKGADDIAAVIYEPVLGSGGLIVPPRPFHEALRRVTKQNGIALIADEVFTGFGRTGKMFAYQHWGFEPDMMTMGKALGGGVPIGGLAAVSKLANAMEKGDLGGTFSGNPLSAAASAASVKIIKKYNLDENAATVGDYLLDELTRLKEDGKFRGDVRGLGLAIGIELVTDEKTKTPDPEGTRSLVKRLREEGVLVGIGGPFDNVVRVHPPLILTEEEAKDVVAAFKRSLLNS